MVTQVIGSLPPVWETWVEFLVLGSSWPQALQAFGKRRADPVCTVCVGVRRERETNSAIQVKNIFARPTFKPVLQELGSGEGSHHCLVSMASDA